MGRFADIYYDVKYPTPSITKIDNPTMRDIREKLSISGSDFQFFATNDLVETERMIHDELEAQGSLWGLNHFRFNPKTMREFYSILAVTYESRKTLVITIPRTLMMNEGFLPTITEKINGGRHIHGEHLDFTFNFAKYGVDHETARGWCALDGNNYLLFMKSAIEFGFPISRKDFNDELIFEFHKWMETIIEDPKFTGRTMDDCNWVDEGECASYLDLPSKFFNLSRLILVVPPNETLK